MKPSICFVALKSYAVLSGDSSVRHIGGAEVQQALIAHELSRRGYRVSFVVLDHGQPDGMEIEGIRLFKAYRPDAGLRGLRFVHPRLTKLWAAMRRAGADVYYQRSASNESGQVCAWCRVNKRSFVFAVAHDSQCEQTLPNLKTRRERILYRLALIHADTVVVQTLDQQHALKSNFSVEPRVIRSCVAAPSLNLDADPPTGSLVEQVLWVGRLVPEKRPDWILRLAERFPNVRFHLVGTSNDGSPYAARIADQARDIPNLTLRGYVAHDQMPQFYRTAYALICTSWQEGFPNVFLEAWMHGCPVISTVDPDGVVEENDIGCIGRDLPALQRALGKLLTDSKLRRQLRDRAHAYVIHEHSVAHAVSAYERMLASFPHRKEL